MIKSIVYTETTCGMCKRVGRFEGTATQLPNNWAHLTLVSRKDRESVGLESHSMSNVDLLDMAVCEDCITRLLEAFQWVTGKLPKGE